MQFSQLLHRFTITGNLRAIKAVHARFLRYGSLLDSLSTCAKLIIAYSTSSPHRVAFRALANFSDLINYKNPLLFNLVISEFCRNGFSILALETLSSMHIHNVTLDSYALCSALTASSAVRAVQFGRQMHGYVEKSGWSASVFLGSALVGLYARSLLIGDAEKAFDEIPVKNTVCANTLLVGYGESKLWLEGIELVRKMPTLNLNYDQYTLTAALAACAGLSAIDMGRQVHSRILKMIFNVKADVFILSALIELYGKCGSLGKARHVFDLKGFCKGDEEKRDVVLWTSMLGAYGRNGHYMDVNRLYKEMLVEGIRLDGVAFLTVISACAHTGQVNLGLEYFESMVRDCGLDPGPQHYSSVVDLLCRAGELEKAWKFVNGMPRQGAECHVSLWGALLQACKDRGNIHLGRLAAQKGLELDPENAGIYALLINLYAKFGMWDEIGQLTDLMEEKGIKKDAGCSWI
ncbi:hypothetical protein Ancab_018006 [Ancistrocladus abbreviatus]